MKDMAAVWEDAKTWNTSCVHIGASFRGKEFKIFFVKIKVCVNREYHKWKKNKIQPSVAIRKTYN